MGAHTHVEATHDHGGTRRTYYVIWAWLLALTIAEVVLAYFQLSLGVMLVILIVLSVVKAALIMAYFMHLKFEKFSLVMTLIPAMVICILLMFLSLPESFRILRLGTPEPATQQPATQQPETR